MANTAAVALITGLSALGGSGLTGVISLAMHRRQARHQESMAAIEREAARQDQHRDARKEAYVQFINQAVKTANANADLLSKGARESEETYDQAQGRSRDAFGELWPRLALVNVEGPDDITELADEVAKSLQAEHTAAIRTREDATYMSSFVAASRTRWQAQRDFTAAARRLMSGQVAAAPLSPEIAP
ncbi:hypothetical protein [Streptomyces sp. NPDC060187]|uniref:hypothetical protein n=1 Tax=Streptomyces sp. NPDC060187 TaxID=3347067 RepID=UPI00365F814E